MSKYQCRIATPADYQKAPMIEHYIRGLSSDTVALMLASALNELDEQRTLCRNQRVRLAELERMTKGIPKPRDVAKYFQPQEAGDALAEIRGKFA